MKFLKRLREENPSSEIAFHLEGILDAHDKIRAHIEKLGEASQLSDETGAEAITNLQIEIYSHLAYHMKQLHRPLLRLEKKIYKNLEDSEQ